jgi:hypothetical protein
VPKLRAIQGGSKCKGLWSRAQALASSHSDGFSPQFPHRFEFSRRNQSVVYRGESGCVDLHAVLQDVATIMASQVPVSEQTEESRKALPHLIRSHRLLAGIADQQKNCERLKPGCTEKRNRLQGTETRDIVAKTFGEQTPSKST